MTMTSPTEGVALSGDEPVVRLSVTYVNLQVRSGRWFGRTGSVCRSHLLSFAQSLPKLIAACAQKVTRKHVEAWVQDPAHSLAYQRTKLSSLRGLFRWAVQERRVDRDPTLGVRLPPPVEGVPRAFQAADIDQLFAIAGRDPRDLAIIALLWDEGLRRSEVSKALIEDWDRNRNVLGVRGKGYRGKVSRIVPLSDRTRWALESYMTSAPARSGALIRSRINPVSGLSPQRVGEIVHDLLMDADLKAYPGDGRSSHSGRHSRATQAVEAGAPSAIAMRFFGWKTEAMLTRYTKGAALDLGQVHELIERKATDKTPCNAESPRLPPEA